MARLNAWFSFLAKTDFLGVAYHWRCMCRMWSITSKAIQLGVNAWLEKGARACFLCLGMLKCWTLCEKYASS